jgi:hypothetical protein
MRLAFVAVLVLSTACVHGTPLIQRKQSPAETTADSLYWRAVTTLDPANKNGTLEAGVAYLDAYLASPGNLKHAKEAATLRSLARAAQQLARVEATLQTRVAAADNKQSDNKARDEEMVKEIQRLKDELAKANEELERIKKRLATPKP